jgi:hypothetical protein
MSWVQVETNQRSYCALGMSRVEWLPDEEAKKLEVMDHQEQRDEDGDG